MDKKAHSQSDTVESDFEIKNRSTALILFASLLSVAFLVFSFVNSNSLFAPGIYLFGAALPLAIFVSCGLSASTKLKSVLFSVAGLLLILAVLDTLRRVYW